MTVRRLSRTDARRVAVRAQLLDNPRPTELLEVVRRLTLLQIDPTAAIAPSADLVAWSRLGSSYAPAQLAKALEDRCGSTPSIRTSPSTGPMTAAVDAEIQDLADWLELDLTRPGRSSP
jgi:hypothetical protein